MTFQRFLFNYAILIALFFVLSLSLATSDVKSGFILLSLICFVVSIVAGRLFFSGNGKICRIIQIAFLIKLSIGICHYLLFFDADYFSGDGEIIQIFQNDFTSYFYYVRELIDFKQVNGILAFDNSTYVVSHQPLLNVIATCMYSFGANAMNIVPINTLLGNLAAINTVLIISHLRREKKEYLSSNMMTGLMWLMTLFPLVLDNAIFVRDITGQFLMTIAAAILFLSESRWQLLLLIPAAYLMSMQRDAYIIAVVVVFAYMRFVYGNSINPFSMIAGAIGLVIMANFIGDSGSEMATASVASNVGFLPLRFFMALVGPFPWSQFLNAFYIPSFASQLYNYFLGIIHVACLFLILFRHGFSGALWKNPLAVMGLVIFLLGVINSNMHITYIAAGTYFLVPLIYLHFKSKEFSRALIVSFCFLFVLNIFWIAIGGMGLKAVV